MNEFFLKRAIALAQESIKNGGGPFGAVIVKNGEIIAETSNSVTKDLDPTAHAEVNCIRQACKKLNTFILEGCEIYASSEPCPMCLSAIYWAHIDKIYFAATKEDAAYGGFDDDFIYKEFDKEKLLRKIPAVNMLQQEGRKVFDIWLKTENKIDY
ncbi:MAG: nucleoside deaminase [Bacteroidales bacterium]|jgi:tRNA(Arg) A34 adenosine deaminase TadA|nr:nucleoside deaminase [Bacteroidales bacterium]